MRESTRRPDLVPLRLKRIAIICPFCVAIIVVAAASCARLENSAAVHFEFANGSSGSVPEEVEIRDFRFYVHDVELLTRGQGAHAFILSPVSSWQNSEVALIDLAGEAAAERNEAVLGTIDGDAREFIGIRFTVGVPFQLNHANPLTAAAPLNRGELFWTWQSGYKFMRVDLADGDIEWSFHLGSTGCSSASVVRPPARACAQPNSMRVELLGFDPLREPVQVRLDEFVKSMQSPGSHVCTGAYADDRNCADIFPKTGLSFESGSCPTGHCKDQRMFGSGARIEDGG